MTKPQDIYRQDLDRLEKELTKLNEGKSGLAWLRLFSFLGAFTGAWILSSLSWPVALLVFVFIFSIFIVAVSKDIANNDAIENTTLLIDIIKKEIAALDHRFDNFDEGNQWKPTVHEYAHDLDIFGRASLYQYINRTTSEQGHGLLAQWLLSPADKSTIIQRQKAVKELSAIHSWRQQLMAYGIKNPVSVATQQKIHRWLQEKNKFIDRTHWKILRFVLPAASCATLIIYLFDVIPDGTFYMLMLLFLAISFSISKMIMPAYTRLDKITKELDTLVSTIRWIENAKFETGLLNQVKSSYSRGERKASVTIHRLKKILDRLDYRMNPIVFIPLSIFLCWDLQQIFALEKWKTNNQQNINDWFDAMANMEALSSLGTLAFNHPGWCFPELPEKENFLAATDLGHPLIPKEKRVDNSFATEGVGKLSLITGSNMAGKSTFLRCVGVNIVLAMMGAPVCAKTFSLSHLKVMSSMRVSDNLEESTSTFYAELKKLKEIIEAVNRKEKVILLLDEILRGTNSADRHTGSKALLRQLIHHNAIGLVATHDLELSKIENEFPTHILNYHFDVQVSNDELYFDYKLKEGICTSMNASILMKKIGIEL